MHVETYVETRSKAGVVSSSLISWCMIALYSIDFSIELMLNMEACVSEVKSQQC